MTSTYRINYQLKSHKRDALIEFIKTCLQTTFVLYDESVSEHSDSLVLDKLEPNHDDEVHARKDRDRKRSEKNIERYAETMGSVEALINDHIACQTKGIPEHSRLYRLVPTVSTFFSPLPLREAFLYANARNSIAPRKFVPPSFNDIRRILNTAQVRAISATLQLITFDGDMTLYADGQDFEHDSALVHLLIRLLEYDLYVCVVTAAGYGDDAGRYEGRLSGLLKGFEGKGLGKRVEKFYVLGGECNFLFQCRADYHLHYIPEADYQPPSVRSWSQDTERITALLDVAQENLEACVEEMRLPATILRKPKAVGLIAKPGYTIFREQLDECVLSTQHQLLRYQNSPSVLKAPLPFCAFNGGSDVWVDIGNKLIGVQILQSYLSAEPGRTLHVGDQFLSTGNDFATRAQCCTLWIINPAETQQVLLELGHLLEAFRGRPGEASSDGTVAPPATTSHTLLEGVQGEEGELTVPE